MRFVGGCVRDGLLGRLDPSGDLDLATPALPHEVAAFLRQAGIKVIPTGLQHGTVTAIANGQSFEITTLREDIACDGRHATVQFTDDFVADAARRDFTINAMSVDQNGKLYDYFDGRDDLKAGRLRFVGDAERRVREDYLRILRFFRFFAFFGKRPADTDALAACRNNADCLHDLSGERIRNEMLKLLRADDPIDALELMAETGVTNKILPASPKLDILGKLLALSKEANPILRLAALVRTLPEPIRNAAAIAERWRFSNAEALRLEKLAQSQSLILPPRPNAQGAISIASAATLFSMSSICPLPKPGLKPKTSKTPKASPQVGKRRYCHSAARTFSTTASPLAPPSATC